MSQTKDVYMVIGGNGFLGRHIVQQLLARGDIVSVFDIVARYDDVTFHSGDISDQDSVASALRKSGTTCIIHTASPHATLNDPAVFHKVNVLGTKAIIAAAVETGVRKLVFTSSAGVVFNGGEIKDVDERISFPEVPMDAYNDSKSKAETAVLEANGKDGLLTVALRPAGIFGPGDRQVMAGLHQVYERGQTHFQIGDNTNLFDWTYVGNVARAHLLAADRLIDPPPAPPLASLDLEKQPATADDLPPLSAAELALISYPTLPVDLTTGHHRIPTCEARPLGPYITPPPNAEKIAAAFADPTGAGMVPRPVMRTRFDQLSEYSLQRAKLARPDVNPLQVAGQVFFITNGEPCYFWDFPRMVWNEMDKYFPGKRNPARGIFQLPRGVGMAAAAGSEWYGYLTGKDVTFTRFKVTFSCTPRFHNIEKARRILGYEPEVGVEEGVKRMVEVSPLRFP
ncbi:C-3 sterol dehydrogenase [Pholiota conissans]|uniref:C-3 sterol dehydrogenase n=1 Tax=Pholiota conissans TaxID=109636 RepID=A0A9P6CXF2_9AGAR|nr:C-3 sterol dehydrogenase [Pholiota conissans]